MKRRGFLQVLASGATAVMVPFAPGRAAVTASGTGGASASRALWQGLYANAGGSAKFAHMARGMGLSAAATQGVAARSIGQRIALATGVDKLGGASSRPASGSRLEDRLRHWLREAVAEDEADLLEGEPAEAEQGSQTG